MSMMPTKYEGLSTQIDHDVYAATDDT